VPVRLCRLSETAARQTRYASPKARGGFFGE
jgi:hypothetical protein